MTATVLVSAANGRTGRAIVNAVKAKGANVRAFIRNPAQVDGLKAATGVTDIVVGDMLKPETIEAATQGCDAVIHVGPPMHPDEKLITGYFVTAAQKANVKRFVYYSVMHPLRREVPHHARKLDTEEMIIESGVPYTIVQPIRYMQHVEALWKDITTNGVHAMPFNTHVKFNVADLADLADVSAKVALEDGHLYATYELAGPESLSQDDMAKILSDVLKRDVKARQIPLDEMAAKAKAAGATDLRIDTMRKMNSHYDQSGFLGNANVMRWLLGREPTTYKAYIQRLAQQHGLS